MGSLVLRPGAPYYLDPRSLGAPIASTGPASQVGSGAVWADDSDGTYVSVSEGNGGYSSSLSADFPPMPSGLTSIAIRIRGISTYSLQPESINAAFILSDVDTNAVLTTVFFNLRGAAQTIEFTWPDLDPPPTFANGARIRATLYCDDSEITAAVAEVLRVHELALIPTFASATGLAPLRQDLCRDDSRVGRVWPSSSQQDSLRRLGGYY